MQADDHESEPPQVPPSPGLADPRALPIDLDSPVMTPEVPDSNESPDVDPPAWEGAESDEEGRGLIDPRPEIPTPEGL